MPLSPDVSIYRGHKHGKRTRCASYYDEDILPSPSASEVERESIDDNAKGSKDESVNEGVEERKGRVVLAEKEIETEVGSHEAFIRVAREALFFGEKEKEK